MTRIISAAICNRANARYEKKRNRNDHEQDGRGENGDGNEQQAHDPYPHFTRAHQGVDHGKPDNGKQPESNQMRSTKRIPTRHHSPGKHTERQGERDIQPSAQTPMEARFGNTSPCVGRHSRFRNTDHHWERAFRALIMPARTFTAQYNTGT
ncbi:MAG: hypothetical protein ACI97B_003518 [Verrucomicrobiales bacterium]|jgi:hypothetical protein